MPRIPHRLLERGRARRAFLVWVLLFASALGVTGVRAAEPPPGILLDGIVRVVVTEPSPDGGPTPGVAVADAVVSLVVTTRDFPEDEPLQVLSATTDATGAAVVTGVARPADDGPAVFLAATAEREVVRSDGPCQTTETWFGRVEDVPAAAEVDLDITAIHESSLVCTNAVLRGSVLDEAGQPIAFEHGAIEIELPPDGGAMELPLRPNLDGRFEATMPVWGTAQEPARITITARGVRSRTEDLGNGCVRFFAQVGSWSADVAIADGEPIPFAEVVTHEAAVGEDCGSVSTPVPTLPPTDAAGGPVSSSGFALVGLGVVLVVAGLIAYAARGRPSRAGS